MNIEPGPEMAITRKKKKKNSKEDMNKKKDGAWCFPDCTMHHKHNGDMVQCHICQIWAHYQCINEEKSDIIGIWCCNSCRKLPVRVNSLCRHMNQLRRDMATLINYAQAFECKLAVGAAVSHSDTIPDGSDIDDDTNGDIVISQVHTNQNADQNQNNLNNETTHIPENDDTQGEQSTDADGTPLTGLEPASSRPIMPVHDVYIGGAKPSTTNDDIRTYLLKIGVSSESIMSIDCVSGDDPQSSAFRVKICDNSIKDTVYNASNFKSGIIVHEALSYPSQTSAQVLDPPRTLESSFFEGSDTH